MPYLQEFAAALRAIVTFGMVMIRDNLKTAGLFAFGVMLAVWGNVYPISWFVRDHFGFSTILAVTSTLLLTGVLQDPKGALTRSCFAIGIVWVGMVWACYPISSHRGYHTSMTVAVILAPAYLLVGIRRGHGIPMRAFVVTAIAILMLRAFGGGLWQYLDIIDMQATRPGRYFNIVEEYILLPFLAAFTVKFIIWWRKPRIPHGHCTTCSYNLTGNVSGICPECGIEVKQVCSAKP